MKKIVLTGGGTMGHVTPNLALLPHLLAAGYEVHYIGTENGMEAEKLRNVPGVIYHGVKTGKLRRYFDWKNFTDPFRVAAGAFQSAHLMGKIKPDVCFSKGGFVAVPVVFGAWLHHVPVVCHESDLTPGLANKLSRPFVRRIATTFPECAQMLGAKAEMVGTPLRPELFRGSRAKGLSFLRFDGTKPVLLMMGGSLGAQAVNKALRDALPMLTGTFDVAHICGKGNLDPTLDKTPGYTQVEFLDQELPDVLAAADLVLSRAGSNALMEFQALARPLLLVPYPKGASRGDQILNAQSLEKRGLCHVLLQENMTPQTLTDALMQTWAERDKLTAAVKNAPPADGTKRVLEMIRFSTLGAAAFSLLVWAVFMLFPEPLIRIFTPDEALIAVAVRAVRIYFCGFVFMSLQFVAQNSFRSLGKARQAIFFSLLRKIVLVVPLMLLLPGVFGLGADGVYWSEPISDLLGGGAAFTTLMLTVYRPLAKELKEETLCQN